MLVKSIIYCSKDRHAVTKYNIYNTTKANHKRLCQTTVNWNMLVKFRYGSEQWVPLKILKEPNLIEVAEFSMARDIADETLF